MLLVLCKNFPKNHPWITSVFRGRKRTFMKKYPVCGRKRKPGFKTEKYKPERSQGPTDFKCIFFGLWNVPCTEIYGQKDK